MFPDGGIVGHGPGGAAGASGGYAGFKVCRNRRGSARYRPSARALSRRIASLWHVKVFGSHRGLVFVGGRVGWTAGRPGAVPVQQGLC